jgi:hypothetical protein
MQIEDAFTRSMHNQLSPPGRLYRFTLQQPDNGHTRDYGRSSSERIYSKFNIGRNTSATDGADREEYQMYLHTWHDKPLKRTGKEKPKEKSVEQTCIRGMTRVPDDQDPAVKKLTKF